MKKMSHKQKVEKLEKQIVEAKKLLGTMRPGRGGGLVLLIQKLERKLMIEKTHATSKFNSIKRFTVSGSYGSGRRTN